MLQNLVRLLLGEGPPGYPHIFDVSLHDLPVHAWYPRQAWAHLSVEQQT